MGHMTKMARSQKNGKNAKKLFRPEITFPTITLRPFQNRARHRIVPTATTHTSSRRHCIPTHSRCQREAA